MDEHGGDALAQARRAAAAQDWPTAAARFDTVDPGQLTADDLAGYADAIWYAGRTDDALRLGAVACGALLVREWLPTTRDRRDRRRRPLLPGPETRRDRRHPRRAGA